VRLEQVIADAFSVLETESAAVGAKVSLPDTSTQVTVDQAEIQEVIVNMLRNSLYWLRQVPQDRRKLTVCVRRKSADEVEIVFSDSGPGVKAAVRDAIFDPYFSTKPDGVGLGLTIAGDAVTFPRILGIELVGDERVEVEVTARAVTVHDDDLRCASGLRPANGGVDLLGVELAALVVERLVAARLSPPDDARHALDVADDVNAHVGTLLR